ERAAAVDDDARAVIDRRVWDLFGETWAVMFTDLSGFSRQVQAFGILHFLQIILEHKQLLEPVITKHDGILIKAEADSLMLIFRRASSALRCGIEMQHTLQTVNQTRSPETKVLLCLGIGYGPILRIGDDDVYGDQVNAASKLGEDTAKANEILITRAALDAIEAEADDRAILDGLTFTTLEERIPGSDDNLRVTYPLKT
ncbi:MAG TPA: adenylate/guanylate cyclase domain-containing protein, partial [Myxococcota bacterium]